MTKRSHKRFGEVVTEDDLIRYYSATARNIDAAMTAAEAVDAEGRQ